MVWIVKKLGVVIEFVVSCFSSKICNVRIIKDNALLFKLILSEFAIFVIQIENKYKEFKIS